LGTSRILSRQSYEEFSTDINLSLYPGYFIPAGFREIFAAQPSYGDILAELNALSYHLDSCSTTGNPVLDGFPFENIQYYIESRLIDLLGEQQASPTVDHMLQACILAAFLCTYMLSLGIWEGCFIPDFAAIKILSLINQSKEDPRWFQQNELLMWILGAAGALTRKSSYKTMALVMIRNMFCEHLKGMHDTLEDYEDNFKKFIWSEHAMKEPVRRFWADL
jgi:hypothetical protein